MKIQISLGKNMDRRENNYVRAVERFGAAAVAGYAMEADLCCSGLILSGGGDIDPARFEQENCGSEHIDPIRDEAELALLEAFVRAGKPVLGICRGHQVIAVWAGGSLIQDLGAKNRTHRGEHGDKTHLVTGVSGVLRGLYGSEFTVNSSHHQGVAQPGRDMVVTAVSPDGVVEAMEHECLPIWSVQFHPERMNTPATADGGSIIQWFLEQCKEGKRRVCP